MTRQLTHNWSNIIPEILQVTSCKLSNKFSRITAREVLSGNFVNYKSDDYSVCHEVVKL